MKNYMLILFSCGFIQLSAQTTFGVRVGAAFNRLSNSPFVYLENGKVEKKFLLGYDIAAFLSLPLSDRFFLQPEVHYLQKGEAYEGKIPTIVGPTGSLTLKNKLSYDFIEVPILLKAKVIGEKTSLYLFAGPSIGYALSRRLSGDMIGTFIGGQALLYRSGELDWDDEFGTNNEKDVRYDISGNIGASIEYKVGSANLILDIRYLQDFNHWKTYEEDYDGEIVRNRNLILSLGIGF